jgi:hypothetical protein
MCGGAGEEMEIVLNLKYHIYEGSVKCPYCDKDCPDDDYSVEVDNQIEFECDHCEKTFWAEMNYSYSTYSDCSLNDIEHDWEQSESHPTVFNCRNCAQHEVRENHEM